MEGVSLAGTGILSRFTRGFYGLLAVLSIGWLAMLVRPNCIDYLALVPAKTFPFLWNIVTASFLVQNGFELLGDLAVIFFASKLVEPVYGSRGLIQLLLVVSTISGVLTFVTCYLLYVITQKESIFYLRIHGFQGLVGGLLVAVKHVAMEQEFAFFSVFRLKAKWLPSLYVLGIFVAGFFVQPLKYAAQPIYATYIAWFYLRFFQFNEETKLRGDPASDFSFSSFFPELIQPYVSTIAHICARLFGLAQAKTTQDTQGGQTQETDNVDAVRRRERGAKALEDRLRKQTNTKDLESGNE